MRTPRRSGGEHAGITAVEAIAEEPLTTKEGWRRFVDRQPHPPVLLGAARLAKLSECDRAAYDDGRRGYHADLPLVSTPIIRTVISTSRLLVQLNRNQVSARRGVIISGASGTGKTTALTQLGRTHELHTRKRYPADRHRLPVLLRHGATGGDSADARRGVRPLPRPGISGSRQRHRHHRRCLLGRRAHSRRSGLVERSTTSPWPPGRARKCRIN